MTSWTGFCVTRHARDLSLWLDDKHSCKVRWWWPGQLIRVYSLIIVCASMRLGWSVMVHNCLHFCCDASVDSQEKIHRRQVSNWKFLTPAEMPAPQYPTNFGQRLKSYLLSMSCCRFMNFHVLLSTVCRRLFAEPCLLLLGCHVLH